MTNNNVLLDCVESGDYKFEIRYVPKNSITITVYNIQFQQLLSQLRFFKNANGFVFKSYHKYHHEVSTYGKKTEVHESVKFIELLNEQKLIYYSIEGDVCISKTFLLNLL